MLIPENGQGSVTVSKEVCGTSGSGSIPDSGPKGDNLNEYKSQNEISIALEKLLKGKITLEQYNRIVEVYKLVQE